MSELSLVYGRRRRLLAGAVVAWPLPVPAPLPSVPASSVPGWLPLGALVLAIHAAVWLAVPAAAPVPLAAPAVPKPLLIEVVKPPEPLKQEAIKPPAPLPQSARAPAAPRVPALAAQAAPRSAPAPAAVAESHADVAAPVDSAPRAEAPVAARSSEAPAETAAYGRAGYRNNPPPRYPPVALEQGWEGTVLLRVRVLADGRPDSVEVQTGSGRKVLDEAAVQTVKRWLFNPARRGDTPVDGWASVPIVFKLAS